jgi:hypothetical protein
MTYKPKYCCQCGEKIERKKWTFFSSGRFCQLCETDFILQEWTPRVTVALILFFGLVGFSGFFQSVEKPLIIASIRPSEQTTEIKNSSVNPVSNEKSPSNFSGKSALQNTANTVVSMPHQNALSGKRETSLKMAENQANDAPTYFCGAATKKGSPCSRRVKGGGRCWQHNGQPAVLLPEKLIVGR